MVQGQSLRESSQAIASYTYQKMLSLSMKDVIRLKKKTVWLFVVGSMGAYIRYCFLHIRIFFNSSQKKEKKIASFAIKLLRQYFGYRGIVYRRTLLPKEPSQKPLLILTLRYHPLSSLLIHQGFDFPVLIPLAEGLKKFRFHYKIPLYFMQKMLQKIAYPDGDLGMLLPDIKSAVKGGYSMVVYINNGYKKNGNPEPLLAHKELLTLLNIPNCTIVFLRLDGIENYPLATYLSKITITPHLEDCASVLMGITEKSPQSDTLSAISEFFFQDGYVMCE